MHLRVILWLEQQPFQNFNTRVPQGHSLGLLSSSIFVSNTASSAFLSKFVNSTLQPVKVQSDENYVCVSSSIKAFLWLYALHKNLQTNFFLTFLMINIWRDSVQIPKWSSPDLVCTLLPLSTLKLLCKLEWGSAACVARRRSGRLKTCFGRYILRGTARKFCDNFPTFWVHLWGICSSYSKG